MSSSLRPSRYPSRATLEKEDIYVTVDEALYCTVAYIEAGRPMQIPTGFCRVGDSVFIHGSIKSHFINAILGQQVSFSMTHLDALVLAPTAFDHSFNYRSVIGFSQAVEVEDVDRKVQLFRALTDRYIPGRIEDVGDPTPDQVQITRVAELSLKEAALKQRNGDAGLEGLAKHGKWVGVIPVQRSFGEPELDQQLQGMVDMPGYLQKLVTNDG